ncbi:MAG: hypothetical protein CSB34_03505 [Desulfobulbus propionicus]|nr:MAG: hypothetical protein CSB34_03505 [Desulfobulbus propionicus]
MIGEIIAIGDELIAGRINNTNSGYAAQHLHAAGHTIRSIHTIGDSLELIGSALTCSLNRADFVIVTGGLGATTDDLTNDAVIRALKVKGGVNQQVVASVNKRHPNLSAQQQEAVEKLAWLPENAEILDDTYRMAGYLLPYEGKPLFFLPGVPPQMETLLVDKVLPALKKWYPQTDVVVRQELYRTFGLPETEVNNRLVELEEIQGVQIGYYPVSCEVHVSLTIRAATTDGAEQLFAETDASIRKLLGVYMYATGQKSLAEVVGELMVEKAPGKLMCTAESCTGGLISSTITQIPGSSSWFAGGVVAYSNALKESLLGVDQALLRNYGAVSPQSARAMAARLAAKLKCKTAVSVTGIAGPGGGSEEKPVGTVYIGLFHNDKVSETLYNFSGNRHQIQEKTALTALDTVRRALLL